MLYATYYININVYIIHLLSIYQNYSRYESFQRPHRRGRVRQADQQPLEGPEVGLVTGSGGSGGVHVMRRGAQWALEFQALRGSTPFPVLPKIRDIHSPVNIMWFSTWHKLIRFNIFLIMQQLDMMDHNIIAQ